MGHEFLESHRLATIKLIHVDRSHEVNLCNEAEHLQVVGEGKRVGRQDLSLLVPVTGRPYSQTEEWASTHS